MKNRFSVIAVSALLLMFSTLASAQASGEISALGMYSMTEDWEGDPFTFEWDSGFNYGAEANVEMLGIMFGGRWFRGDFDLAGLETDLEETWSQSNLEGYAGYKVLGTPLYLMVAYRNWTLDIDTSSTNDDLSFSFDGIGVGGAVRWNQPASNLFFNVQGLYFFELDSSLDGLREEGFDYLLSLRGEIGMDFDFGLFVAAGVQFEQVHQNLPVEERVAPFTDYGFEQTSVTVRVGYRFSL